MEQLNKEALFLTTTIKTTATETEKKVAEKWRIYLATV